MFYLQEIQNTTRILGYAVIRPHLEVILPHFTRLLILWEKQFGGYLTILAIFWLFQFRDYFTHGKYSLKTRNSCKIQKPKEVLDFRAICTYFRGYRKSSTHFRDYPYCIQRLVYQYLYWFQRLFYTHSRLFRDYLYSQQVVQRLGILGGCSQQLRFRGYV